MNTFETAPPVLELRQYLLRQGRREDLIELFDREFVETQESVGLRVVGQFRDLDRPNRFVWIRGFSSHETRNTGLATFYGGPVWKRFGPAANETVIDSDDVLLLRGSGDGSRQLSTLPPRRRDEATNEHAVVVAIIHRQPGRSADIDRIAEHRLAQFADHAAATIIGTYETDPTPNGYPGLPVRRSDCSVWFATTATTDGLETVAEASVTLRSALQHDAEVNDLGEIILELRRLTPTTRSTLARTDWPATPHRTTASS